MRVVVQSGEEYINIEGDTKRKLRPCIHMAHGSAAFEVVGNIHENPELIGEENG